MLRNFIMLALAVVGVSGCATASSTTRMLAAQTQESRALLSLEQANTRQLTAQRAALQSRLAGLTKRRGQLVSGGGAGSSELRKVDAEIAQLKRMLVEQ